MAVHGVTLYFHDDLRHHLLDQSLEFEVEVEFVSLEMLDQ